MVHGRWVPLRVAWHRALYADHGFYRVNRPADHFRTSPQVSGLFAGALVSLARQHGLTSVCDVGAGAGELLEQIHEIERGWRLTGVEVRPRPPGLPQRIHWQRERPSGHRGLILANELLDNIACDAVRIDDAGCPRVVEVDLSSGELRLGSAVDDRQQAWLTRWWPLSEPGGWAEIGAARDTFWADLCAANPDAVTIAVDYGHHRSARPAGGSLSSYRGGLQVPVSYDGSCDITAHVAFDSLAAAAGGTVRRQWEVLDALGVSGRRPPIGLSRSDPAGYLRALSLATEGASLTERGALGDFCWLLRPSIP